MQNLPTETRRLRLPKSLIDRITALARSESRTWTNMARVLLEQATESREDEHGFVSRAHSTIEEARSRMSDEERERADEEARAIFNRASIAARSEGSQ